MKLKFYSSKRSYKAIIVVLCLLLLPGYVGAEVITWTGESGNWDDAANWDLNRTPEAVDEVIINKEENILLNSRVEVPISKLTIQGKGTLTISGSGTILKVTGDVNIGYTEDPNKLEKLIVQDNGKLIVGRTLYIGHSGNGTLEIVGGGAVETIGQTYIGWKSGANGIVSLNGGTFNCTESFFVGYNGVGSMEIGSEETKDIANIIKSKNAYIGHEVGSTSNTGSKMDIYNGTITVDNEIRVGNKNKGNVTLFSENSKVESKILMIGYYYGNDKGEGKGDGEVIINKGTWTTTVRTTVGSGGIGQLTIGEDDPALTTTDNNGQFISFGKFHVLHGLGQGTLTVNGLLKVNSGNNAEFVIGMSGGTLDDEEEEEVIEGVLQVNKGGMIQSTPSIYISSEGIGRATVHGSLSTENNLIVGNTLNGVGKLIVEEGGSIKASNIFLGYNADPRYDKMAKGTLQLKKGSTVNETNKIYVGNDGYEGVESSMLQLMEGFEFTENVPDIILGNDGYAKGTLQLRDGSKLKIASLKLGEMASTTGHLKLMPGSELITDNIQKIGDASTFTINGGQITTTHITNSTDLIQGFNEVTIGKEGVAIDASGGSMIYNFPFVPSEPGVTGKFSWMGTGAITFTDNQNTTSPYLNPFNFASEISIDNELTGKVILGFTGECDIAIPFTGQGSIDKTGSGAITLSGNNSCEGTFNQKVGAVTLKNQWKGSYLQEANAGMFTAENAEIAGDATFNEDVTLNGALNIDGNLALGADAVINIDLTKQDAKIEVGGNLTNQPANTINITDWGTSNLTLISVHGNGLSDKSQFNLLYQGGTTLPGNYVPELRGSTPTQLVLTEQRETPPPSPNPNPNPNPNPEPEPNPDPDDPIVGIEDDHVDYKVWTLEGQVFVQTNQPQVIRVYNINGKLYANQKAYDQVTAIALPKGIYIVESAEQRDKIIIK